MKAFFTFLKLALRHPVATSRFGKASLRFWRDYVAFARKLARQKSPFAITAVTPMLADAAYGGLAVTPHYFQQDLHVARRIFENRPEKHVDVGSRIDGFVAHVAAFRQIEVLDVRDPGIRAPNIVFRRADIMAKEFPLIDYCDSASSLHVIEHLGLGRYGDRIDPDGHVKGLDNIWRMLKPGGQFYLSVPVGEQRIEFNAHRVFSLAHVLELIRDRFVLNALAYEDDQGQFREDVELDANDIARNLGCHFGCAVLVLTKRP